jgi:hypothetical protein
MIVKIFFLTSFRTFASGSNRQTFKVESCQNEKRDFLIFLLSLPNITVEDLFSQLAGDSFFLISLFLKCFSTSAINLTTIRCQCYINFFPHLPSNKVK